MRWREENLGSNELAHYYLGGDRDAIEAVDFAASMCGKAVSSLLNILNPDLVFFGGGFIKQIGEVFLEPVRSEASKCMRSIYRSDAGAVPIEIGVLDNPMLVGACRLALHEPSEVPIERTLIAEIRASLSPHQVEVLKEVAEADSPVPISKDPHNDFYVDVLRPLRDAGLVRTDTGRSLGNSGSVRITPLGRAVADGPADP
jgi:hypothetical protein